MPIQFKSALRGRDGACKAFKPLTMLGDSIVPSYGDLPTLSIGMGVNPEPGAVELLKYPGCRFEADRDIVRKLGIRKEL